MNYSVKMNPANNEQDPSLKFYGSIKLDNSFTIENVTVRENSESQKLFVNMPSYKTNQVDEQNKPIYKEYCHPITKEFREVLYDDILKACNTGEVVKHETGEKLTAMPNVTPFEKEGTNLKGLASVVFNNEFVVNSISIRENTKTGGLFVAMPSYRSAQTNEDGKPIYKDHCHPTNKEFREGLNNVVLTFYNMAEHIKEAAEHENAFEPIVDEASTNIPFDKEPELEKKTNLEKDADVTTEKKGVSIKEKMAEKKEILDSAAKPEVHAPTKSKEQSL